MFIFFSRFCPNVFNLFLLVSIQNNEVHNDSAIRVLLYLKQGKVRIPFFGLLVTLIKEWTQMEKKNPHFGQDVNPSRTWRRMEDKGEKRGSHGGQTLAGSQPHGLEGGFRERTRKSEKLENPKVLRKACLREVMRLIGEASSQKSWQTYEPAWLQ